MDDVQVAPAGVALAVRVVEPVADARHDEGGEVQRHALAAALEPLEDRAQVLARHVLHRDVVGIVDLSQVEGLGEVGVAELGSDLRLVDEHLDELFVFGDGGEDAFDGDDLLEALHSHRLGFVDLGHPAHVDALEEEVLAEGCEAVGHEGRSLSPRPLSQGGSRARICWKRGRPRMESRSGSCSSQARKPCPVPTARSSKSRALFESPAREKPQAAL